MPTIDALTAELEAALVRELATEYAWINRVRFGMRLRMPVITLSEVPSRHGRWVSSARTLELARALVLERVWPEVIGVLEHEMAHQFVDEVLGVREETAHGETFRKVCVDRGIDARAGGPPVASTAATEIDRVLERIRKLLALAGSPNQHEAEIAMRKAHEVIRLPVYLPRTGTRGSVHEISGTRPNVEMAAHVYAFLLATAERLWRENRGDKRVRSGRDRLSYQSGVVRGFREKLGVERTELRGTGLVWRGDAKLDEFYRARHPRITTRRQSVRLDGAHAAGREAGRTVVLHRPVESSGGGGPTRLLR